MRDELWVLDCWKVLVTNINIARFCSITKNARLQQVTFKCLSKNRKMLAGCHAFFSLISRS